MKGKLRFAQSAFTLFDFCEILSHFFKIPVSIFFCPALQLALLSSSLVLSSVLADEIGDTALMVPCSVLQLKNTFMWY